MPAKIALLEPVDKTEERKKEYSFPRPTLQKAKPYSWGLRNYLQLAIFLFTIGIGIHFFIYFLQASGDGLSPCPDQPVLKASFPLGRLWAGSCLY